MPSPPEMQPRSVERLVRGIATSDGAGVRLTRVLTQDLQRRLDPFLLLEDRVPADNRDLNYSLYFSEGKKEVSLREDFNSHNTTRLDVDGMCTLLLKLECVQKAMKGEPVET